MITSLFFDCRYCVFLNAYFITVAHGDGIQWLIQLTPDNGHSCAMVLTALAFKDSLKQKKAPVRDL
jgi:hypothetical protein